MRILRIYRILAGLLASIFLAGCLVWLIVRAPAGTSSDDIFRDVEMTGAVREVVLQTAHTVRRLADAFKNMEADASAANDELLRRRGHVEGALAAIDDLSSDFQTSTKNWIPVAEAQQVLFEDCRRTAQRALQLCTIPNSDEDASALQHTPAEVAVLLDQEVTKLLDKSTDLRTRVKQAIDSGMLARGSLLGYSAEDLLLGMLFFSTVLGIGILVTIIKRVQIPLDRLERLELELVARTDRRAALSRCHMRIKELLQLADSFSRRGAA